jgi:glycosyltransferase involved in cell wall biosynthesis
MPPEIGLWPKTSKASTTSEDLSNARRFRIGIWCDYGFTLTPKAGIGVFVYNLVAGLLSLDEPIEVVMLVSPGDQEIVSPLRMQAPGRLRVAPPPNTRGRWLRRAQVVRATWLSIGTTVNRLISQAISRLTGILRALLARARQGNWAAMVVLGIGIACAPAAFLLIWALYAGRRFVVSILRGFFYPVGLVIRGLGQRGKERIYDPVAEARACACDVWLIPFAGFPHRLDFSAVLAIHDLIHVHFPDTQDPELRRITEQAFRDRAAEATLCACMSNFIRDHDLKGVLNLQDDKIRMIRPAAPRDLDQESGIRDQESEAKSQRKVRDRRGASITQESRPYIFYPSGFRPHKNHQILIETIHRLRTHLREDSFDLVFSGDASVPEKLAQMIQAYALVDRVHVLGCVDRSRLADLYQRAFATIVPSLYEQGSFPIYEALHWHCPVACSDIPALREQCEAMGDSMLYFDPRDPDAIARIILQIRDGREAIATQQYAASRCMWERTWTDVAREWVVVFREAAEIDRHPAGWAESEKAVA